MPTNSPVQNASLGHGQIASHNQNSARERLDELWPLIQSDARAFQEVASPLTPTQRLIDAWGSNILYAPAVHTGRAVQAVLTRLPRTVDHLLLLPSLGTSDQTDQVAQRLLRSLRGRYRHDKLAVFAPDAAFNLPMVQRLSYDVPIVALNDVSTDLPLSDRVAIVDLVLSQLRPRTIHVANSDAGMEALQYRAGYYAADSSLFVSIYSDTRSLDGEPTGHFWRSLPKLLPFLSGVISDNSSLVRRAVMNFSLASEQQELFSVLHTPVLGLNGEDPALQCRPYCPSEREQSLWTTQTSGGARLVNSIASKLPERKFLMYAMSSLGSAQQNYLASVSEGANVEHRGLVNGFEPLPLDEFDSCIFTTSPEGVPLSVLEAAKFGLPTVAPSAGGTAEFIDDTTGWLVPDQGVDDFVWALEEIVARPAEAAQRVARAQARLVERHSWSNFERSLSIVPNYLVAEA